MKKVSSSNVRDITRYKESGKRIKEEARKRHMTNDNVAEIVGCGDGHQISPIYSGTRYFEDDEIQLLADYMGLRKEYLMCLDDWPTEDDLLNYAKLKDMKDFQRTKAYLESIGMSFTPYLALSTIVGSIYRYWNNLVPYLTDESINSLLSQYPGIDSYSPKSVNKDLYMSHTLWVVELKKPIDELQRLDFNSIGKTKFPLNDMEYHALHNDVLPHNREYSIGYKIYYNGAFLCHRSIYGLQAFMEKLDTFSKFAIDMFLPKDGVEQDYPFGPFNQ